MLTVEQVLATARQEGAQTFTIESEVAPRWRLGPEESGIDQRMPGDELTAFLFRTMPAGAQARLAMGQPVEFRAQIDGSDWNLRATSTHRGLCLVVSAIRSVEETVHHLVPDPALENTLEQVFAPCGQQFAAQAEVCESEKADPTLDSDADEVEHSQAQIESSREQLESSRERIELMQKDDRFELRPPPCSLQPQGDAVVSSEDGFDRIELHGSKTRSHPEHSANGTDEVGSVLGGFDFSGAWRFADHDADEPHACQAGVPDYVEDVPFGISGPIGCSTFVDPSFQGAQFDEGGTLLFVHRQRVLEKILDHLPSPSVTVDDQTSMEQTHGLVGTLEQGSCVLVLVEDPSLWFAWVMRRLEQGCTVVVVCRAQTELGAIRVFCGLNPEVPTARWLAEHRRIFLPSTDAVNSLFSGSVAKAASY